MDQELQKIILNILAKNPAGMSSFDIQHDDLMLEYWLKKERSTMDSRCNEFIRFHDNFEKGDYHDNFIHQIDLLGQENKILKYADQFRLTPEGHVAVDIWYKQAWYFILYGKNNLLAALSFLVSIAALMVSFFK